MNKVNRYPKGYFPNIKYWSDVRTQELLKDEPDLAVVDNAHAKLDYFIAKHSESESKRWAEKESR
jgi:hypothetical protein